MKTLKYALVLGACMGAASFGIDSLTPALPLLAEEFGISSGDSQLALTVAILGFALGQIPAGMVSDRYGRRMVLYFALSTFSLSCVLVTAVADFSQLLLLRFVQGISLAGLAVSARAIVRDVSSGVGAGQLMSAVTTVMASATVFAPLVGGYFSSEYGWRSAFVVMAAYGLACLIPVRLVVPATRQSGRRQSPWRQLGTSIKAFAASRQSIRGVLVNACAFSGLFGFITSSAALARDVYHVKQGLLGPAISLIPLMLVVASQVSRKIVGTLGLNGQEKLAVLVLAIAGTAQLGAALFEVHSLALIWTLAMIYTLGFGLLMPVVTALVLDPQPRSAGFAAAILGTTQSAAGAGASALMAVTYDQTTLPIGMLMGAAGLFVGVFLFAFKDRE